MAKKVVKTLKLQVAAGKANPAPPIGPALGGAGINIMDFCKRFNAETQGQTGDILPVVITVFQDKSFTFVIKNPPVAEQLKKAAGIAKGSGEPNRDKVGKITQKQAEEIAQGKLHEMNARDLAAGVNIVLGTARSMGIELAN